MMEENVLTPKIKINKKELILSEAAMLFKEKGFGGTSMRDLAEKVGMEAASMYNHIKSKDEILELIYKISWNRVNLARDTVRCYSVSCCQSKNRLIRTGNSLFVLTSSLVTS